ncbi:ARM repeat-containing protein [Auricularia subglabra TFB-10046 SS5]|nr:ARM repeat-containing protein [Auricularia subglabra TFB-10046 SS5]
MFSASLNPATRPDGIKCPYRYNPSNISVLEDYLYHQIRNGEYDCFANLAVLKLYQFNPDLYNPDVAINILPKALCAAPLPDFNLCVALLGQRTARLSSLLLRCRFPAFWAAYASDALALLRDNYPVLFTGFEDAVRDVVGRGAELDAYIAKLGWTQDNGVVSVPANPDNTIQATVVRENI